MLAHEVVWLVSTGLTEHFDCANLTRRNSVIAMLNLAIKVKLTYKNEVGNCHVSR